MNHENIEHLNLPEKDHLLAKTTPSVFERIGQVGVHEAEHITNPNARSLIVGKVEAERVAEKREMEAIRQTIIFNKQLPVLKFDF